LTRKYSGVYVIIDTQPGYNYKLKDMTSGKELKHFIHASRLRPLITAEHDERLKHDGERVKLFEYKDDDDAIHIEVTVGNVVHSHCDSIVCPTTANLQTDTGNATAITRAAGEEMTEACQRYSATHGLLEVATPLATTAGDLQPTIKSVIHIVAPNATDEQFRTDQVNAQQQLELCYFRCLKTANELPNIHAICIPPLGAKFFGFDAWTIAHCAAKAVRQFISETHVTSRQLKHIEFINLTLSMADITSVVFREVFQTINRHQDTNETACKSTEMTLDATGPSPTTDMSATQTTQPLQTDEVWYPIDKVLKHKRVRSKDFYLVKWPDSAEETWVERKDVTIFALQEFYRNRPQRRRRRARHW